MISPIVLFDLWRLLAPFCRCLASMCEKLMINSMTSRENLSFILIVVTRELTMSIWLTGGLSCHHCASNTSGLKKIPKTLTGNSAAVTGPERGAVHNCEDNINITDR